MVRGVREFLRDERGVETVEFIVWIPFIVFLLVIVTDTSFLYFGQTQMWNVARDTARRLTTGDLTSVTNAETFAENQLGKYGNDYTVTAEEQTGYVRVIVKVPVRQLVPFGLFTQAFLGDDVIARVVMRKP